MSLTLSNRQNGTSFWYAGMQNPECKYYFTERCKNKVSVSNGIKLRTLQKPKINYILSPLIPKVTSDFVLLLKKHNNHYTKYSLKNEEKSANAKL
jgi:hypothetical protein